MTVIVYRDGVMAADSRAWSNGHAPIGSKLKIRRMVDGTLLGAASSVPGGGEFVMDWYAGGADPAAALPKEFTLLAVKRGGEAYLADDTAYLSGPLTAPHFAIGTGRQYALGALLHGASAVEAVEVAIELDTVSGGEIVTVTH